MTRKTTTKSEEKLAELRTLVDEIRLKIHLGTRELRDEWSDIEQRFREGGHWAQDMMAATDRKADEFLKRLRLILGRLGRSEGQAALGLSVRDIMVTDVKVASPGDSLQTAAQQMWDADVGCLPVLDDDKRVIGMVTDRDICMAAFTQGHALSDIRVYSAMANRVFSCRPDDALQAVEEIMGTRQVRRLPVIDENRHLVGIVALNDVVRATVEHAGTRTSGEHQLAETLAAIGTPRGQGEAVPLPI